MQSFRVEQPGPLLDVLVHASGNRTQAKKCLRDRQVVVNDVVADRHDQPVAPGDVIRIGPPQKPVAVADRIERMPVVYQDDAILVVEKPAGLLTIATDTERSQTAYFKVNAYLKASSRGEARAFIVHRLDRETSGLLVFALTEEAKRNLQDGWDEVEKRYYAIVFGTPVEPAGTIESYLSESESFKVYSGPKRLGAKHAVTHYRLLATVDSRSLLEVRTETGRKHQIRVHLQELGHVIVGDDRYGDKHASGRLALHASYLRFRHPVTGAPLEFRSELPRSLARGFPKSVRKPRSAKKSP